MHISKETIGKNYVLLRPSRRCEVRHLIIEKVTDETGKTFLGYAKNMSLGGIFVSTVKPKPIDFRLVISFKIPESDTIVSCEARVSWVRDFDPENRIDPGMGLEFLSLDSESRDSIESWFLTRED